ncbi:FadR family transcriptional regulator [Saccharophagus sp. K07]|jgi:DNA-binding FadR family transcriptional regulator|uniref:FadR/GntR family transcriptional regulator n=1 Tax=Saccharophagus sp. K07 TaxID=2283636 RepID=UPI0016527F38|nr:FadR/GntR family transcriptional regulator [Saccharophagus sp. K07]MBC6904267.1 FadR family transcriptional regulator [Saccharophagus sp. K07]
MNHSETAVGRASENIGNKAEAGAPKVGDTGRLYQRVAEQLAEVIASGEYPVGSRLPAERKLAERFNVSRPTVREAIIALELAGCVEVKGGSGVYVTSGSSKGLASTELDIGAFEILEARLIFESEAAALAAKAITDQELADLRAALASMVAENEQVQVSENADEIFHLLIAKATHNEAVVSVCKHLWALRNNSKVSASILEKVRRAGSRPRIDEHARILDALEKRDPAAARQAMRDHLNRVADQLLDSTEEQAVEEALRKVKRERERFARVR